MKCIKHKETTEICRVPNEEGARFVRTKAWNYCPKSEWREYRRLRGKYQSTNGEKKE